MTDVDVFIITGQSNATGEGDSSGSPDVATDTAWEYDGSGLVNLDDPVHTANTGSAWPAFQKEYYSRTGRKVVYVPTAVYGSGMAAETYPTEHKYWEPDGTGYLTPDAITKTDNALSYLNNNGYNPTIQGMLISQGEADAENIDSGAMTKSRYKEAFNAMVAEFRSQIQTAMDIFIFQTGRQLSSDTAGTQDIRDAQSELATSDSNIHMVSDIQVEFATTNRQQDKWHYNQTGYNDMGVEGATNTAPIITNTQATNTLGLISSGGALQMTNGGLDVVSDTTAPSISNFTATVQ